MSLFFISLFFCSMFFCWFSFKEKLLVLLFLEISFLMLIFSYYHSANSLNFFFLVYFMVFLVLESVLLLSLFVSSSRGSSWFSQPASGF